MLQVWVSFSLLKRTAQYLAPRGGDDINGTRILPAEWRARRCRRSGNTLITGLLYFKQSPGLQRSTYRSNESEVLPDG